MLLSEVQRHAESYFSQCAEKFSSRGSLSAYVSAVRDAANARLSRVLDDATHFANILRNTMHVPSVADVVRTVWHRIYAQSLQPSVALLMDAFRESGSGSGCWGAGYYYVAEPAATQHVHFRRRVEQRLA